MRFLENKIPPPLVGIFCGLFMWWSANYLPVLAISAMTQYTLMVLFVSSGLFFDLAGIISFRTAKTTVNPLKPETASALVTSGIYQYSRNPMYVGFVFFLLAWATFLGALWGVGFIGVYVAYIQRFQIIPEERALANIFKDEFIEYKNQVRPWL